MSYTPITVAEMDALLQAQGFRRGTLPGVFEYVYAKGVVINGTNYAVCVYSSIDTGTGRSRNVGEDAIRVCLTKVRKVGNQKFVDMMAGSKRVNRTENWRTSLNERIGRFTDLFIACPQCGAPMVERRGKARDAKPFLGCSTYHETGCRGTREK